MQRGQPLQFIKKYLLLIILLTILVIGFGVFAVYESTKPINFTAINLSKADEHTKEKASQQMTISITGLPAILSDSQKKTTQNILANLLRQAYGQSSTSLTATTRPGVSSYDEAKNYQFYIDIPAKNITYSVSASSQNDTVDIACALQEMQMNPTTSACPLAPGVDGYYYPKG